MMRARTLVLMSLVAAVAVVAIFLFDQSGTEREPAGLRPRSVLPPEISEPGKVAAIAVRQGDQTLTLARSATGWGIVEHNNYPADTAKVERALAGLATSRRLEPRTSNPEFHERFDLEDPARQDAASIGITLRDADSGELVSLVLGKNGPRIGEITTTLYARYGDDPRVWLIEGPIEFDAFALDWLDRRLIDLKRSEVARLTVDTAGHKFTLTQDAKPRETSGQDGAGGAAETVDADATPEIAVTVAEGDGPAPDQRAALMGLLANVAFQDVRRDGTTLNPRPIATYETADGMTISLRLLDVPDSDTPWARLGITGADNPRADRLSSRVSGWLYELPGQVLGTLQRPLGAPESENSAR